MSLNIGVFNIITPIEGAGIKIVTESSTGTVGQVLTANGDTTCSWQNSASGSSNSYPNFSIPFAAFNYFVASDGTGWINATSINDPAPPSEITPGYDFGTRYFDVFSNQLGTYRFALGYDSGTDCGIINFICDGVTTTLDMYAAGGANNVNFQWEQTFTTPGRKGMQLINNGKNVASTDYYALFASSCIYIYRIL